MMDNASSTSTGMSSSLTSPFESVFERSRALDRVGIDAKEHWPSLKEEWKVDKEFIIQALTKSKTLPKKSEFERLFPQSLRFDRDVVLAFTRRPDFPKLFEERLLHCPGILTGDKEVMMAYCRFIPRSLQQCSEDLIDDHEVVEAAISLGGLELQYASLRLQNSSDMVRKACNSHGEALAFCPLGSTRNLLTDDKDFMFNVVLAKPGGGPMWKLMSPKLKQDVNLLKQALKNGLGLRDVPHHFRQDLSFLRSGIKLNPQIYLQLHTQLQADTTLARSALLATNTNSEIQELALYKCPTLTSEREVFLSVCCQARVDFITQLLANLPLSAPFKDDMEIMKAAVTRSSSLFEMASLRLQATPELVCASITATNALDIFKIIPEVMLRAHPEISIRAVEVASYRILSDIPNQIPVECWRSHRPLALAWIRRGMEVLGCIQHFVTVTIPYEEEDLRIPLALVENNWMEVERVGSLLLADPHFIWRALALDSRILQFTPLRYEMRYQVAAVAHSGLDELTALHDVIEWINLRDHVRTKLEIQQSFCKDFLRGIAIVPPNQPFELRSPLHMLDGGVETSQALKRIIAEYLGVPFGEDLLLLRRADANLLLVPPGYGAPSATRPSQEELAHDNTLHPLESERSRLRFDRRRYARRRRRYEDRANFVRHAHRNEGEAPMGIAPPPRAFPEDVDYGREMPAENPLDEVMQNPPHRNNFDDNDPDQIISERLRDQIELRRRARRDVRRRHELHAAFVRSQNRDNGEVPMGRVSSHLFLEGGDNGGDMLAENLSDEAMEIPLEQEAEVRDGSLEID